MRLHSGVSCYSLLLNMTFFNTRLAQCFLFGRKKTEKKKLSSVVFLVCRERLIPISSEVYSYPSASIL